MIEPIFEVICGGLIHEREGVSPSDLQGEMYRV